MNRPSLFKRGIPAAPGNPATGLAAIQNVQGGAGDVHAVQDGNLYVWKYQGDPQYRLRPAGTGPAMLSEALARRFPSRLLATRYEVVDLIGRKQELEELTAWASTPAGTAVRLVHAVGGQGKTRLVARFAHDLAQVGWAVVEAHHRQALRLSGATTATDTADSRGDAGLPVIIDYADRWPTPDLFALLAAHINLSGPVRVLLVARGLKGPFADKHG